MSGRVRSLAVFLLAGAAGCGTTAVEPPTPDRAAVLMSMGPQGGCLIGEDEVVWCWDQYFDVPSRALIASRLPIPASLVTLSVGFSHGCGLTADGEAWCWGDNTFGQLGVDAASGDVPVRVANLPALVGVSAGGLHTCGWTADGMAWCWGDNRYGQLGDQSQLSRVTPDRVAGSYSFDFIDAGLNTTCGISTARVACWGDNRSRVIPTMTDSIVSQPAVAMASDVMASVAVGQTHVCGLSEDGAVYCWGQNEVGQVGDGTTDERPSPVQVVPPSGWQSVDAGPRSNHTCARDDQGAVFCWGENLESQSGARTRGAVLLPTLIEVEGTYLTVSVGRALSCGLDPGGGGACWGAGSTFALPIVLGQ